MAAAANELSFRIEKAVPNRCPVGLDAKTAGSVTQKQNDVLRFFVFARPATPKGKNKTCNFTQHVILGQDKTSFSESPGSGTYKYRVKASRGAGDDTAYSNEVKI